jgi:alpha-beta hydrolase superfamily lysophospholipase
MKGEFCRFRTSDGLELQGLYVPAGDAPANGVVLHVHGLDGSFYENRFIDAVAAVYNRHGLDFLTFNNRGHDYISDILVEEAAGGPATYRQAGGMYEVLEECVADIAAAAGFARGRGCRRVLLEGHSHGALKVLYYLVRARDPAVSGLVLMSPSDDFATARAQYGDRFAEGRVTGSTTCSGRIRLRSPSTWHGPTGTMSRSWVRCGSRCCCWWARSRSSSPGRRRRLWTRSARS